MHDFSNKLEDIIKLNEYSYVIMVNYYLQAAFYDYLFQFWDRNTDKLELIIVDCFADQSEGNIITLKDYYGSEPAFIEYISTLGLFNQNGTPKQACQSYIRI